MAGKPHTETFQGLKVSSCFHHNYLNVLHSHVEIKSVYSCSEEPCLKQNKPAVIINVGIIAGSLSWKILGVLHSCCFYV